MELNLQEYALNTLLQVCSHSLCIPVSTVAVIKPSQQVLGCTIRADMCTSRAGQPYSHKSHPDYVPSLFHASQPGTNMSGTARYKRLLERNQRAAIEKEKAEREKRKKEELLLRDKMKQANEAWLEKERKTNEGERVQCGFSG